MSRYNRQYPDRLACRVHSSTKAAAEELLALSRAADIGRYWDDALAWAFERANRHLRQRLTDRGLDPDALLTESIKKRCPTLPECLGHWELCAPDVD